MVLKELKTQLKTMDEQIARSITADQLNARKVEILQSVKVSARSPSAPLFPPTSGRFTRQDKPGNAAALFCRFEHQISVGKSTIDMMVFNTTARTARLSRGPEYGESWREFRFTP